METEKELNSVPHELFEGGDFTKKNWALFILALLLAATLSVGWLVVMVLRGVGLI
jgi:hypothetical protein